jgi:hypothetical protein
MNKKIISGFLMFALAVFSMSSFVACKDYDEDSYDDLKARLNKEISLREALQNQVNALDAAIKQIKSCNCDPSKYASKDEFDKAMKRIDSIADALSKIKPVEPGKDYDADIKKLYENDSLMVIKMNEINSWIVYVQNLAKQDSIRIDSLSGAISGWGTTITTLYTRVDSLIQALKHGKKDTIYISGGGCDSLCAAKIAKAQFTADSALLIAEKALVLAVHNANRIAALENYVNNLVQKGELANEVQSLNDRLENLLEQMITGIIIQGVSSPVLGYLNTPFDVRSQMLAAFYGNVTNAVKFPATTNTADLVDISMAWTPRNIEVMGTPSQVTIPAGRFVSQKNGKEEGNAGTLYLTLNPAGADFEGRTLSLVDSKDNAAAVTLSPLAKADTLLSFGYTRAAANNGLYETQATLTKDNIDAAKLKIDYTTFEEEAKAIVKEKSISSVLTFGATLLQNMDELLPAYAVKATWTRPGYYTNYDRAQSKDFNVYSQYGIAATAIKPLSFAFLKDFNAQLPGEARVQSLFDQIMSKINININLGLPDFSKYQGAITFKDIDLSSMKNADGKIVVNFTYTLKDADGNTLYVLVTTKSGKYAWKAADGRLYDASTGAVIASDVPVEATSISINADVDLTNTLQQIINQINTQFGANSDLAKNITSLLNDVASLGSIDGKINKAINDAKTDIKNVISSYITAAYKKLNHWISVFPNKALQPTLLAVTGDKKAGILSQSFAMPTKASGTSLTLVPTTFTLETLAPAYKKFVAVTNVWKDGAEAPAAKGKAANGTNMLKVIDSEKTCTLNGEAGYLYEVSYSAVDYHGKIVTKRFYVQF